jgi:UPF0716 protein FxsA
MANKNSSPERKPARTSLDTPKLGALARSIGGDYFFRLILVLLVYALVPVGEILLFVFIGDLIGNYLVMLAAGVAGLAGSLLAYSQARAAIAALRGKIATGGDPGRELADLAGVVVAGVLLITPGFVTDAMGYVLLIPSVRQSLGRAIARRLSLPLRQV